MYFATKDDAGYTISQIEELTVTEGVNELDVNIAITTPCYLVTTCEDDTFYFQQFVSGYQPLVEISDVTDTPLSVGDTFTVQTALQKYCYIGVWIGMETA